MRFDQELTFVRDDSVIEQRRIEELLEKYEFTRPPQIGESAKKSKRKLFTHSHFEEEIEEVIPKVDARTDKTPRTPKSGGKENKNPETFKWPSPKKKLEVPSPARKTPVRTPKATPKSTQENLNRFGPLSFLKSLDAESNRSLCDADALFYRNNYKNKKQELAEKLFDLYNMKVFRSELKNVPMKWNKKLLNTAGRCNNSRRNGVRQSSLELSDKVHFRRSVAMYSDPRDVPRCRLGF